MMLRPSHTLRSPDSSLILLQDTFSVWAHCTSLVLLDFPLSVFYVLQPDNFAQLLSVFTSARY